MSVSESIEGNFELNQNTLCVYGLSKGRSSGVTEYINLLKTKRNCNKYSSQTQNDQKLT
jgi:hypothetical protein